MNNKGLFTVMGVMIVCYALLQTILGISENVLINQIMPIVLAVVTLIFTAVHGSLRYGIKQMIIFFLITSVVSWSYENIGVLTGFPFGNYHYTDKLGFKLLHAPLIIMPAYFGTGYLSWTIAQILLGEYNNKLSGQSLFIVPFVASFIMVMWDLTFDPYMSTISGNWVWETGGAYFGVPFVNFMGWFLCVFTIYILFAFYLRKTREFSHRPITSEKYYWIQGVIMYALLPFCNILKVFFSTNQSVASPDGHIWWTGDIYLTGTLVSIFTMYFVSILAIRNILSKNDKDR